MPLQKNLAYLEIFLFLKYYSYAYKEQKLT